MTLTSSRLLTRSDNAWATDGEEEWFIDRILDEWRHSWGYKYLVHWCSYGVESN